MWLNVVNYILIIWFVTNMSNTTGQCHMWGRYLLLFRSTRDHLQILMGSVFPSHSKLFFMHCCLSVCLFLYFEPWRCLLIFELWVWMPLFVFLASRLQTKKKTKYSKIIYNHGEKSCTAGERSVIVIRFRPVTVHTCKCKQRRKWWIVTN